MKIRDGFVTNSSSTSYIIMSKKELTAEFLAKKLGLTKKSFDYYKILNLCQQIINDGEYGFYHYNFNDTNYELVKEIFGEITAKRYEKALHDGYNLYCGKLSSDENDGLEITLCLDSFTLEDKDFFMDASDCGW